MKYSMEKITLALCISAVTTFHACQDTPGDADTKDTANVMSNTDTTAASTRDRDTRFLEDMVKGNYEEVKLAQLGKQKSSNKEIDDIAEMLEMDHTAALNQLKDLSSKKSITVPTEEDQDAKDKYKSLSDKSGKEFDKAWCEALVDKHKKTIDKLEDIADDNADSDLKSWASNTLPKIRTHHDKLKACHDKLK
jgi:putative membrane protein